MAATRRDSTRIGAQLVLLFWQTALRDRRTAPASLDAVTRQHPPPLGSTPRSRASARLAP